MATHNPNLGPPGEEEWQAWEGLVMTKALKEMLRRERERLKEALATDAVPDNLWRAVTSKCEVYKQLLEMTYAEFYANYTGEAEERGLEKPAEGPEQEWPTAGRPRGTPGTL